MNERASTDTEIMPRTPGFLVVGVGASAGGLQAFQRLLAHLPADSPMALVLVQHLARDRQSLLAELLGTRTEFTVVEGKEVDELRVGHVYVIQPTTHVSVIDGCLRVQPRPTERTRDVPVDHLFESMADEYREKAVAVVLSGGGADGSRGAQQIHGAGGMTFAQAPEEAQVAEMPRSVISSGAVSLVAPVERIAKELVRLAEHPFYRQRDTDEAPSGQEGPDAIREVLNLLRKATGVDFTHYKLPTIRRRIQRRMAFHHLRDWTAYRSLLTNDDDEAQRLHDDILIHVTSFFRDPESFEALKQEVLPRIAAWNRGDGPIRVWVPGCSSGEEAYSLAMALAEVLRAREERTPITVFGTDLSQRMVEHARAGLYSKAIAADVPAHLLQRYFVKVEGGYRVATELRERCVFARQDITRDPPFSKLDLVMCRNLLIYLSQAAQRKVTEIFHYALLPHGFLALGRSESIGPLPELFSVVDPRWKIYQRKQSALVSPPIALGIGSPEAALLAGRPLRRTSIRERRERDLQADANRVLIDRYVPPLVIVDDAFHIVRTQGRVGPYLEVPSGQVSLDFLRMLRPGLMSPVRTALHEVRSNGNAVRKEALEVRVEDTLRLVDVEVTALAAETPHYLVVFEDKAHRHLQLRPPMGEASAVEQRVVERLQFELSEMRGELESLIQELEGANEELQSANEEILSSNEELQSTNEELDTAREELQAANEELGAVNEELQTRNEELSRAHGDLVNLLDSIDIPLVMVTSELKIRRFTRAAQRTLNLIPADMGRPIGHIKPAISFPDLEAVLREAIERSVTREREVRDSTGRTYLATIRPHADLGSGVAGAILALLDVPVSLAVAREMSEALLSATQDPIVLLDANWVIRRANQAFYDTFSLTAEQSEGTSLYEFSNWQWDIPELRERMQELLSQRRDTGQFAIRHGGGAVRAEAHGAKGPRVKTTLFHGKRIDTGRPGEGFILLIIREEHHP